MTSAAPAPRPEGEVEHERRLGTDEKHRGERERKEEETRESVPSREGTGFIRPDSPSLCAPASHCSAMCVPPAVVAIALTTQPALATRHSLFAHPILRKLKAAALPLRHISGERLSATTNKMRLSLFTVGILACLLAVVTAWSKEGACFPA